MSSQDSTLSDTLNASDAQDPQALTDSSSMGDQHVTENHTEPNGSQDLANDTSVENVPEATDNSASENSQEQADISDTPDNSDTSDNSGAFDHAGIADNSGTADHASPVDNSAATPPQVSATPPSSPDQGSSASLDTAALDMKTLDSLFQAAFGSPLDASIETMLLNDMQTGKIDPQELSKVLSDLHLGQADAAELSHIAEHSPLLDLILVGVAQVDLGSSQG